jgi:hypothetical protein
VPWSLRQPDTRHMMDPPEKRRVAAFRVAGHLVGLQVAAGNPQSLPRPATTPT